MFSFIFLLNGSGYRHNEICDYISGDDNYCEALKKRGEGKCEERRRGGFISFCTLKTPRVTKLNHLMGVFCDFFLF